jgi:hypothetical protein
MNLQGVIRRIHQFLEIIHFAAAHFHQWNHYLTVMHRCCGQCHADLRPAIAEVNV